MSNTKNQYCGTQYGYRKHKKLGTLVCEPCRVAMNTVNTLSRKKNHEKELERHRKYREKIREEKTKKQAQSPTM